MLAMREEKYTAYIYILANHADQVQILLHIYINFNRGHTKTSIGDGKNMQLLQHSRQHNEPQLL